jgi:hypothetical protein
MSWLWRSGRSCSSRCESEYSLKVVQDSRAAILQEQEEDTRWEVGECISYDNVGPISPESSEGLKQFHSFRDMRSKYMFNYPIKICDEDTFCVFGCDWYR